MINKNKLITSSSYLIILLIFFFIGRLFFDNWSQVKEYEFVINYPLLVFSFLFLIISMLWGAWIWNQMLGVLESKNGLPFLKAFKIFIYSWFGKYLPGKVWMYVGRIYLGAKEGISKESLSISSIYEIVLSISAEFMFSILLLSFALGVQLYNFYAISIFVIISGLGFIHPKIFNWFANFVAVKLKKESIPPDRFFSYSKIALFTFYYFISFGLNGFGFFLLINSFTHLPAGAIIGIIGSFHLATALGIVAIFAPSGLGVREGVLVSLLQFYLPLEIAIIVSVAARIWVTIAELILLIFAYTYSKISRIIAHCNHGM